MKIEMVVDGETHVVDIEKELTITGSPEAARQRVCAEMGFWGAVWAAAVGERERADIAYRSWRGQALTAQMGTGDKGKDPAEWKAVAFMEQDPAFRALKDNIAEAESNAAKARVLFDCFRQKAEILTRMLGRERAEEIHGRVGEDPSDEPTTKTEEEKLGKMEAAMSRSRRRRKKGESDGGEDETSGES